MHLPPALEYIPETCFVDRGPDGGASDGAISGLIPINLNNDNHTDFVVSYWCRPPSVIGATGAVPNATVAFVSTENGEYYIDNIGVFGQDEVVHSGSIGVAKTGDINGDGRQDLALLLINEDGRTTLGDDGITNNSGLPTVYLSGPTGVFTSYTMGVPLWGGGLQIQGDTVHFAGSMSNTNQAGKQSFKFNGVEFDEVSNDFPYLPTYGFEFLTEDHIVAVNSGEYVDADGYTYAEALEYKRIAGEWVETSRLQISKNYLVDYLTWAELASGTNQSQKREVTVIDGVEMIGGHPTGFEVMNISGEQHIAILFAGYTDATPNSDGVYVEGENATHYVTIELVQVTDTGLVHSDVQLNGFNNFKTTAPMDVLDVDGDGNDDLVYRLMTSPNGIDTDTTGVAEVYLSNPDARTLSLMDPVTLGVEYDPAGGVYDVWHDRIISKMQDFNNDGLVDVMFYDTTRDYNSGPVQIYYANKTIAEQINE